MRKIRKSKFTKIQKKALKNKKLRKNNIKWKKSENQTPVEESIDKPARRRRKSTLGKTNGPKATVDGKESIALAQNKSTPEETNNKPTEATAPRRGWWNRLIQ